MSHENAALTAPACPTAVFDLEVYKDYFLAAFKNVATGKVATFEMWPGSPPLNVAMLRKILQTYRLISFNGNSYDMPILTLAMEGASCQDLKDASNKIIEENMRVWDFERAYGLPVPRDYKYVKHIDLIEVAFGQASLKIYGGRLHCRRMQDLPIHHDASIDPQQRAVLKLYCVNDLDTTQALFAHLAPQLEIREQMSIQYDQDLRSKSDAQIAEAVIRGAVTKLRDEKISRQDIAYGHAFKYECPDFIRYESQIMQDMHAMVLAADFTIEASGKVNMPKQLAEADIAFAGGVYRMGIGGLHSSESSRAVYADEEWMLVDRDVASYYPAIIIRLGLHPKQMGDDFLRVYSGIVKERLAAKAAGDTVTAQVLKIVINGSFGKFGSPYSTLYSPHLLIQTTITGQLSLLMLIEMLELAGMSVVSANTDGIVIRCRRSEYEDMVAVVAEWERRTGFQTEETPYKAVYSRDVNNYIALTTKGKTKGKGVFGPTAISKNPQNEICVDAVRAYLTEGKDIEDTIRGCTDIRKFVSVRAVKGGGVYGGEPVYERIETNTKKGWRDVCVRIDGGEYLGKAVRWYMSTTAGQTPIRYVSSGNLVPRSVGCRPCMELPDRLPADVDLDWYIAEANSILADIGCDIPHVDRRMAA